MVDAVIPLPNNHGEATDEALLLAYRTRHDRGAAGELIRRYERPLYGYLLRYTGNPGLAEELFQTTFQRVIERADQFAAERKFRPWLYSIATHLAIDAGRRSGRSRTLPETSDPDDDSPTRTVFDLLPDREPAPSDRLEAEERRRIVHAAVDQLPDEQRRIVMLVYFQGLTLREAAEALEIPIGTLKTRLHKALLFLLDRCERIAETDAA